MLSFLCTYEYHVLRWILSHLQEVLDQKQKENITYGIRKLAHLFRAIQAVDNGAAAGGIRVIDSDSRVIQFLVGGAKIY